MNSAPMLRMNEITKRVMTAVTADGQRRPVAGGTVSLPPKRPSLQPQVQAGTHVARCCAWVELGTVPVPDFSSKERGPSFAKATEGEPKTARRVMVTWLIRGQAGESWRVSREFALSAGPRSGLRKLLESWRGRPFASDAEARAVMNDPRRVLEQPALVSVGFKPGSTWPKVEAVLPMLKGLEAERLRWPPVLFCWASPCRETFKTLAPWVQRKIRASEEWGGKAKS